MLSNRQIFLSHIGQTSNSPLLLEIESAKGILLFGTDGKQYIDLISGISVSNVGHCHPKVVEAVCAQAKKYMHLMVYGELVQSPQVQFAKTLTDLLPHNLKCSFLVNSGSEAIEGAMKLAKRFTGRHEIIAFNNAYHGSTQGALSIIGSEYFRNSYRPLLPDVRHINFNNLHDLEAISSKTSCVIVEPVQGEAGAVVPDTDFLKTLSEKCKQHGVLLIFDEIQTGFRRTGPMMAFMETGVVPDILVLAKAMGGGMPIGAFISSNEIMNSITNNPVLGHITTFGGHPVSCAAALASLNIVNDISEESIIEKGELFRELLVHDKIKNISGKGLLLAIEFESEEFNKNVIDACIRNGVFTDWFLFAPNKMRIAPPLIIETHEIIMCCWVILQSIDEVVHS